MLEKFLARFGFSPTVEVELLQVALDTQREATQSAWAEVDRVGDELAEVRAELTKVYEASPATWNELLLRFHARVGEVAR